jgi:hypothetical protein
MTPTLTGAPATNPATGARRYTGAEFIVRLAEIHRLGTLIVPKPKKPRRNP